MVVGPISFILYSISAGTKTAIGDSILTGIFYSSPDLLGYNKAGHISGAIFTDQSLSLFTTLLLAPSP